MKSRLNRRKAKVVGDIGRTNNRPRPSISRNRSLPTCWTLRVLNGSRGLGLLTYVPAYSLSAAAGTTIRSCSGVRPDKRRASSDILAAHVLQLQQFGIQAQASRWTRSGQRVSHRLDEDATKI